MKQFKVGQSVVHLSHGVGEVTGIEEREFSPGKLQKFYILTIQDCGAPKKVFVPFSNAGERVRAIISKDDANKVFQNLLTKDEAIYAPTWNIRYREYMEMIHTGDIFKVGAVFKDLLKLKKDKELSFGERKLLEQAKDLLVKELSASLGENEEAIEFKLESIAGEL